MYTYELRKANLYIVRMVFCYVDDGKGKVFKWEFERKYSNHKEEIGNTVL